MCDQASLPRLADAKKAQEKHHSSYMPLHPGSNLLPEPEGWRTLYKYPPQALPSREQHLPLAVVASSLPLNLGSTLMQTRPEPLGWRSVGHQLLKPRVAHLMQLGKGNFPVAISVEKVERIQHPAAVHLRATGV